MEPIPVTSSAEPPTIFLVNQISSHGHLDLYARLYSACLLELGYRVVLIAQHESGVRDWIAKNCAHRAADFSFFVRSELKPESDLLASVREETNAVDGQKIPP